MLKLADDPEPTFIVAGTVRLLLSLLSVRVSPPAGTAFESDTVQALLAFGPKLAGVQTNELTASGATRLTVVLADEAL